MLSLVFEFPAAHDSHVLPAPHARMFNAPHRGAFPTPFRWEPHKWDAKADAEAAARFLRTVADPAMRWITFVWPEHDRFIPQGQKPEAYAEDLYKQACRCLAGEPSRWRKHYFEPFVETLRDLMPDEPCPNFFTDGEKGYRPEHLGSASKTIYARLASHEGTTVEAVMEALDREPVTTIRRDRAFIESVWGEHLFVNFGDNGTTRTKLPNNWTWNARDSVIDRVSCMPTYDGKAFPLSEPKNVAECMKFAREAFAEDPRSLPMLSLIGLGGQTDATLASLAKGFHDIGYRRCLVFNGYAESIKKNSTQLAAHYKTELDTIRAILQATE